MSSRNLWLDEGLMRDRLFFWSDVCKKIIAEAFTTGVPNSVSAAVEFRCFGFGGAIQMKVQDRKLLTDWVPPRIN